jgi:quercetin dioxygenase-like cupin family protein
MTNVDMSAEAPSHADTSDAKPRHGAARGYSPSPRPTFTIPTAIPRERALRYVWGDDESGHVVDWIYASTSAIHCLVFGLPAGGSFTHSREFRTVFGADEVLRVLSGTMMIANPETGEVQRAEAGQHVFFRRDTWHHAFAHGAQPLRVLELFAPPPSAGTSGVYARTRPFLEHSRYADDALLDRLAPTRHAEEPTLAVVTDRELAWRLDLGVPTGFIASTEHLTVHTLEVSPGMASRVHAHDGEELLFVTSGTLWVRAWHHDQVYAFELGPHDACFLPEGCEHEYRNVDADVGAAVVGVAPTYASPPCDGEAGASNTLA